MKNKNKKSYDKTIKCIGSKFHLIGDECKMLGL